jgi:hypothetical protein
MEPIFYNPRIGGPLNDKIQEKEDWELIDRKNRPECKIVRSSSERREKTQALLTKCNNIADMGITHMVHLMDEGSNGAVKLHNWKSLRNKYGRDNNNNLRQNLPINENEYKDLLSRIPKEWKDKIDHLNSMKSTNPALTTKQLIERRDHEPGTWIRRDDGKIGKVEDGNPKVLHAFSGRAGKHDGLAKLLLALGIQCQEIDTLIHADRHNLSDDSNHSKTIRRAKLGYYAAAVLGVPCSTFSVSRIGSNGIDAPAPVQEIGTTH